MLTYDALLSDWGKLVGVSLRLGAKPVCCVRIPPNSLELHLDLDQQEEQLILSFPLGDVPLGAYADQLLLAALIHNGVSKQPRGILSYSDTLHKLLLHERLPLAPCSATTLQARIQVLSATASIWKTAIEQQVVPSIDVVSLKPSPLTLYPQTKGSQ